MTEKKPTIASLKREIERLKARNYVLKQSIDIYWEGTRKSICGVVDAEMKIKQAMAILMGEDQ
ncbi:MAG: hypothetical protein HHJ15_16690 [Rhodoferax sp.]|uniref:hypothetical protein n=1 Tax=Rhodoferax sp. TaxID=50421 RepID=UPI00184808CE|nr:hypothetical protein [Rhodoferax sp.]NMM21565.1 hypothetical protein [Rhodoferax sp.]